MAKLASKPKKALPGKVKSKLTMSDVVHSFQSQRKAQMKGIKK